MTSHHTTAAPPTVDGSQRTDAIADMEPSPLTQRTWSPMSETPPPPSLALPEPPGAEYIDDGTAPVSTVVDTTNVEATATVALTTDVVAVTTTAATADERMIAEVVTASATTATTKVTATVIAPDKEQEIITAVPLKVRVTRTFSYMILMVLQ